jgi:hypothetical protein
MDGRLYVVLTASNFHPGKGTPTTTVDMRRISDGVKVSERWRTTEMVEKATVDEREYDFLYEDGEGFHFMEPNTYEQVVGDRGYPGRRTRCTCRKACAATCEDLRRRSDRDGSAAEDHRRDHRDRAGGEGADGLVVLQAGDDVERAAGHGAAAYRAGHRIVINTDDDSYVERAKD